MAHTIWSSGSIRLRNSRMEASGFQEAGKRWFKPENLAEQKHEAARQKQADKQWGQKLEKCAPICWQGSGQAGALAEKGWLRGNRPAWPCL